MITNHSMRDGKRENPRVNLRAYRDGLHLIITPNLPIEDVSNAIYETLAHMNQPLAGVSVQIDITPPALTKENLDSLRVKLEETYNLQVSGIDFPKGALQGGSSTAFSWESNPPLNKKTERSKIVRKTVRSGQTESFPEGNLIIYGNVNPGGEVSAGRDIIVLGSLRGVAHAGMNGRLSSVIVAMNLVPLQLQIGNYITRPIVGQKPQGYPEIARIGPQDVITVEALVTA